MKVSDPVWIACFGTTDSQLEPAPKATKQKLNRAQLASKMINDTARLRDAKRVRTLFDAIPPMDCGSVEV